MVFLVSSSLLKRGKHPDARGEDEEEEEGGMSHSKKGGDWEQRLKSSSMEYFRRPMLPKASSSKSAQWERRVEVQDILCQGTLMVAERSGEKTDGRRLGQVFEVFFFFSFASAFLVFFRA